MGKPKSVFTSSTPKTTTTTTTPTPTQTQTNDGITTSTTPTPTTNPYSQTQNNRQHTTGSVSPNAISQTKNTQAQPANITYATNTKTGEYFIIPSNLSLQERQHYATLGISTSSTPPTQTNFQTESPVEVTVDPNLINVEEITSDVQSERSCDDCGSQTNGYVSGYNQLHNTGYNNNDLDTVRGDESVANDVQFNANSGDTTHTTTADADKNWNGDNTTYLGGMGTDDALSILTNPDGKYSTNGDQYLPQIDDIIVPRPNYLVKDGAGTLQGGINSFKSQLGNIMSSKYFPFLALGFVALIVIMLLRGKGSSAPQIPTSSKVINF